MSELPGNSVRRPIFAALSSKKTPKPKARQHCASDFIEEKETMPLLQQKTPPVRSNNKRLSPPARNSYYRNWSTSFGSYNNESRKLSRLLLGADTPFHAPIIGTSSAGTTDEDEILPASIQGQERETWGWFVQCLQCLFFISGVIPNSRMGKKGNGGTFSSSVTGRVKWVAIPYQRKIECFFSLKG